MRWRTSAADPPKTAARPQTIAFSLILVLRVRQRTGWRIRAYRLLRVYALPPSAAIRPRGVSSFYQNERVKKKSCADCLIHGPGVIIGIHADYPTPPMNLRQEFNRTDSCPCGSGVNAGNCCLKGAGLWNKRPANVQPPAPASRFANPNCYAHSTNDCSSKMSREHYISHDVLRCFESAAGTVGLTGAPWLASNTEKSLSPERLVARILCSRHNHALSPLDAEAGRLFRTIGNFDRDFNEKDPSDAKAVFSGEDVERWMLKTVCGMVASGHVSKGGIVQSKIVNQAWVDVLFRKTTWQALVGMYVGTPERTYHSSSFSFQSLIHPKTGELVSVELQLNGITFSLLLRKADNPNVLGIYRPRMLVFKQGAVSKFLEFSWQDSQYRVFVEFTRMGTYDGPSPSWSPVGT